MELIIAGIILLAFAGGDKGSEVNSSDPDYLKKASDEIGQKELPGDSHNSRILEYLDAVSLDKKYQDQDETPWCSAFVNWVMKQSGYSGTNSAKAKSWLNYGVPVVTPKKGTIVILDMPETGGGHVGFYMKESATSVYLLGGNQSNAVNVTPFKKERILGYVEPKNMLT